MQYAFNVCNLNISLIVLFIISLFPWSKLVDAYFFIILSIQNLSLLEQLVYRLKYEKTLTNLNILVEKTIMTLLMLFFF